MSSSQTLSMSPSAASPAQLGLPSIAFAGRAGAGKSSAAALLNELGYETRSFARPLKDIAAKLWGEDARTDRSKLQRLGVAVREIEADTWVDLLLSGVRGSKPIAVDDLRFENEWWALKGAGFVIVRLTAGLATRVDRLKGNGKYQDDTQLEHISESAVDHLVADYHIENNYSKDDLYDQLVDIILKERRRR